MANTAADTKEFGSTANLDLSKVPAVVEFHNKGTKRRLISISGINQSMPIEAGQKIKLRAETSSELIGYLSQEDETMDVVFDAVSTGSGSSN